MQHRANGREAAITPNRNFRRPLRGTKHIQPKTSVKREVPQ